MLEAIKYNLRHLADFDGRDARQTFWYYVLFLVVLQFAAGFLVAIPMIASVFGSAMEAARSGVDDPQQVQAILTGNMADQMTAMLPVSIAIGLLMSVLLVAAFVRRLHDSGKSGWWAALPLAMKVGSLAMTYATMGRLQAIMVEAMHNPDAAMQAQRELAPYSLLGWIAPVIVIVFGVMKSTDGPNRYGDEPVRF